MRFLGRVIPTRGVVVSAPPSDSRAGPEDESAPGVIADRVARARRRRGLSQAHLGARVGKSLRWIQLVEHGELPWIREIEQGAEPTPRQRAPLSALAACLHLELDELLRPAHVVPFSALTVPDEAMPAHQQASAPSLDPPRAALVASATPSLPVGSNPSPSRPPLRAARWPATALISGTVLRSLAVRAVLAGTTGTTALAVVVTAAALGVMPERALPGALAIASPAPRVAMRPAAPPLHTRVTPVPAIPVAPDPIAAGAGPALSALPSTPSGVTAVATAPPVVRPLRRAAPPPVVVAAARSEQASGPVATLTTTGIDFGTVRVGTTVSRTVTLTNTGRADLHLKYLVLFWAVGVSSPDGTNCEQRTLAPGQHCSFTLVFSPTSRETLAPLAQVDISDDAPGGRQEIDLRGTSI
jgi:hypothetical protein